MDKVELRKKVLELSFKLHHDLPPKRMSSLTEGEKGILGLLFHQYPKAQYSGDLAILMKVGTGRIGNALKSLEAKNLIVREIDDQDKRKVLVSLTDEGYQWIKNKMEKANHFIETVIEEYGVDKFETFITESEKLLGLGYQICMREGLLNDD